MLIKLDHFDIINVAVNKQRIAIQALVPINNWLL